MWAQLAMAGMGMLQNNANQQRQNKVNEIQTKYGPWLSNAGAQGLQPGKTDNGATIAKTVGNIMAQNQEQKQWEQLKQMFNQQPQAQPMAGQPTMNVGAYA